MQFPTIFLLSLAAFVSAAPQYIPGTTKRQTSYSIQACINSNLSGQCTDLRAAYGTCTDVPASFDNAISSLAGDQDVTCYVFAGEGCKGNYFGIAANKQLLLIPADMNDAISSVLCPNQHMD